MHLDKQALQEDILQLVRFLVESHPYPYSAGGPIAFYRRVTDIFTALPDRGLTREQFLRLVRPLVASLGDGHTSITLPAHEQPTNRLHLWLEWDVVERQLYISQIYRPEEEVLLGARLQALETIPFAELVGRMGRLQGFDNEQMNLMNLASALSDPILLLDLLESEALPAHLHLTLRLPDGREQEVALPTSNEAPGKPISPATRFTLPEMTAAQIGWKFLDPHRKVAYLRIDSLSDYREAFECSQATGYQHFKSRLDRVARKAVGDQLPERIEDRIAAIPSATALLCNLCAAMREAASPLLVVDLTKCQGGNSLFALILSYFIYGLERTLIQQSGYHIPRYSPLYFENYQTDHSEEHLVALLCGGYDFTNEQAWLQRQRPGITTEEQARRYKQVQEQVALMPTFQQEFARRTWEATWTPAVTVLCSARTYSAGFDTVAELVGHGARLLGVPSAQAGNCFIDTLQYQLLHSGLEGGISYKWTQRFPDELERGKILQPDIELSYDYLVAHHFDPNAAVWLALDHLASS